MAEVIQAEKTLAEQIADLVQRKPQHYDVVFSVGPENVKVKAIKIILKAASPVFESEFENNWESAVMKESDGIPLPDLDATLFELFVNLIISDTWSVKALKSLSLSPNTVLSLLGLCERYRITKAIKNLEEAADDFIQNLNEFKDTAEYLEMSLDNLKTVLSCDSIPLDEKEIFECACRWAEHQCTQKKFEQTGENWREVLGSSIFEIRFPTMKFETFAKVSSFKKNLLTVEEIVAIFHFMGLDEDEKPRNLLRCSVLRLPQQYKIMENPSFVCDGTVRINWFQVTNKKILLHGVGFLGPIDGDAQFEVTLRISKYPFFEFAIGTVKRNIFAQKGKMFYVLFDAPIAIEVNAYDISWDDCYDIDYSLKGAQNVSQFKVENPKHESVQISGVEFYFAHNWNSGSPLVELLFKKKDSN